MLLSDEWFAGGVTHKAANGAYAMKLHEHDKYNGTLKARKSFFAIENRIICLGSDIENGLEGAPVHTTLFQNSLEGVDTDNLTSSLDREKGMVIDNNGVVYIVKNADIHYFAGLQKSLHEESDKPTEGKFETAYINHGDIVKDGRYEYVVILPDAAAEAEASYNVIRHDSQAHCIKDSKTGIVAAAVFEEGELDEMVACCTPAMLMYSIDGSEMTLSVANPDLAMYEGESDEILDKDGKRIERSVYGRKWIDSPCAETLVTLTLNGHWEIHDQDNVSVICTHKDSKTTLTFRSKEARTEEITLIMR